ncbi:MAG: DUF58 domain-containing protein [Alphaproteobacteria bacterium]|nr:DUF58 domain-containing protein [Alphaproteobacteria bacterium]
MTAFSLKPGALRHEAERAALAAPDLLLLAEETIRSLGTGEHARRRSGPGHNFRQFRDYVPGDLPRSIDWRRSARSDERLYVRQTEEEKPQTALIWRGGGPGMDFRSKSALHSKVVTAQILALSLAILLGRGGERARMLDSPEIFSPEDMARYLCAEQNQTLPPEHVNIPAHAHLILIGDFLNPPEQTAAAFHDLSAKTRNGLVIQVLDPAELELPYEGAAVFTDPEGTIRARLSDTQGIRTAYAQRIQDHIEQVRTCTTRTGWAYHLHRTDSPPEAILRKIMENQS